MTLVAGGAKVNNLDNRALEVFQQDVFGFEIAMNQPRLVEQRKPVKQLLGKDSDQRRAQPAELVLFDELVQVDAQQLEDQAQMLPVNECILEPEQMMIVVLVELGVELPAAIRTQDQLCEGDRPTKSSTDTSIILWLK